MQYNQAITSLTNGGILYYNINILLKFIPSSENILTILIDQCPPKESLIVAQIKSMPKYIFIKSYQTALIKYVR